MNKTYGTKEEQLDNFKIKYKKHPFSKSIKISLKSSDSILVTMPYFCPYKDARSFLLNSLDKIKSFKIEKNYINPDFKTKFDTLNIIKSDTLKTEVKNKIVNFYYPDDIDFYSDLVQQQLYKAYLKAVKIEAEYYLPERLRFLAEKFNFAIGKISLRNQKTRFGSCSFCNNISLNINLMKYDFDIIDYVLIHELCHTRIKNHSQKFWHEVEKYCPDWKNLRKRLKTI